MIRLTKIQTSIAHAELDTTLFAEGMAGVGKTTAGVRRLRYLIEKGVPADSILIFVPQKTLAFPYQQELHNKKRKAGGQVAIHTIGSLALRMIDLYWPLIGEAAGFAHPHRRPTFLSLEMAQYVMARVIGPEIDRHDYFASVRIDRNRLYSQIVDNLNKAAVVGFPYTEIGERLKAAWTGEPGQQFVYDDTQKCVSLFRDYCRQHNLLDFSYQVELFRNFLWSHEAPRRYLTGKYRHLIVDNSEEDNPATHHIISDWLGECESAVVIYDSDAGYRRFLGSDADHAYELKARCKQHVEIAKTYVMSTDVEALNHEIATVVKATPARKSRKADPREAIAYHDNRYYPQMIKWTAENIASLVHDAGESPGEIVVLAPLLSDALRFSLVNRLQSLNVPVRSHRPSRALRDEPAARALLTLAKLAHPEWEVHPTSYDVTYALMDTITDLDLTRARLLTEIVYRQGRLSPFESIRDESARSRITYDLGGRYERLWKWLEAYREGERIHLDFFFSRLFGEMLSQPGFGFHQHFDAAKVASNLIDSAKQFRWAVSGIDPDLDPSREYLNMVDNGVIANQYIRDWELNDPDAVLIAPAYTFLMSNRPVDFQFWLNIGSPNWATRLYQPLTHPYVLSLEWEPGQLWTDARELEATQDTLYRLITGLIRRCRRRIYLGYSQFGEQGYEQRGPLLDTVQRMLRRHIQD
jgi:hypothetical protein